MKIKTVALEGQHGDLVIEVLGNTLDGMKRPRNLIYGSTRIAYGAMMIVGRYAGMLHAGTLVIYM
jgi:hypothetical protein